MNSPSLRPSALSPSSILAGLVLGLAGTLLLGASTPPQEQAPPDLKAGAKIYKIDVTEDSYDVLASLAVTQPIDVLEVRGTWIRVRVPDLPYGPVWLNTQQVVYYRTTRGDSSDR